MNRKPTRDELSRPHRIATWAMAVATSLLVLGGSVFAFFPGIVGLFFWREWHDSDKAFAKKGNKP